MQIIMHQMLLCKMVKSNAQYIKKKSSVRVGFFYMLDITIPNDSYKTPSKADHMQSSLCNVKHTHCQSTNSISHSCSEQNTLANSNF